MRDGAVATLPTTGIVRSWYVEDGRVTPPAPDYLARLPPGYYSSEGTYESFETHDSFHARVIDLPPGRLVTRIDIRRARRSAESRFHLQRRLGFCTDRADRHRDRVAACESRASDPRSRGAACSRSIRSARARAAADHVPARRIQVIARASNAHLERVERFIERERSLLDQASHEFRTPIAVIAGAVDVLRQQQLPDSSTPALNRIAHAVEDLSETMVALLYLAREANAGDEPVDVTALHDLLPRLLEDHAHLLRDKTAQLRIAELEPTFIAAPEAMVRIAVSNLIRNAIENTDIGFVELSLKDGIIAVADSGSGFNPVEAARRYRESLRESAPIRGQGLGLFLIGRICDRFGWKLAIEPVAIGGTRARLDVTASVIVL